MDVVWVLAAVVFFAASQWGMLQLFESLRKEN